VLVDLEEADIIAGGERSSPRGVLTISAPPILGEEVLRPIVDDFLQAHPDVAVRFLMLDRFVNLIDEGVDVALRIGNLTDSTHISVRIGGDVRRVVVASPEYLAGKPSIYEPSDLSSHHIIAFSNFGLVSWSFSPVNGSSIPRTVHFTPRYMVNSVRSAAASAAAGIGVTRLYSYHVADLVRDGRLQVVLASDEPAALPVHLLTPQGRTGIPKVRAFIDFAVPRLRAELSQIATQARPTS
jgi:DNA-binding transcriptional LysR family regulator